MNNFRNYAKFYDLFYKKKNYSKESMYIESFFKINNPKILDFGMGTGRHLIYFLKKQYSIDGVELSDDMINIAKNNFKKFLKNKKIFFNQNLLKFRSKKKYDVIYSVFHVVNYLNDFKSLKSFFKSAHLNMSNTGILIFDTWNYNYVKSYSLKNSLKKISLDGYKIERLGKIKVKKKKNININIEYEFKVKKKNKVFSFAEKHDLAIFSKKNIMQASKNRFQLINNSVWFKKKTYPNKKDFSSFYVFKKI